MDSELAPDYEPDPIDTSQIFLDGELVDLVDMIAASVHDRWALQRMAEGWRYGPERNDQSKTHPDLVAYENLPESEKAYDRATVEETLKSLRALGFEIRPNDSGR